MPEGSDRTPSEPTILGAMWRFRWLALLLLVVGAALGVVFARLQPTRFQAVASFVVQDPQVSTVFNAGDTQQPERFVADQVAILESTVVAGRAAELAEGAGVSLTADDILEDATVISDPDSDHIQIQFEADDAESALAGANSVADAYQDIRREAVAQNYTLALEQLDESIAGVAEELVAIGEEISARLAPDPARQALNEQYAEALVRLAELQEALAQGPADQETADQTRLALDDLQRQFETLELVSGLEGTDPEVTALLDQQTQAIGRQSDLIQRRDELQVDAELKSTGIVVTAPALEAEEKASELPRSLAVGLVLGGLLGAALSYILALRRRPFSDRLQPEAILGAPFLGEVPDFGDEGIKSELPVLTKPTSASAEAFRFVAAALDAQLGDGYAGSSAGEGKRVSGGEPVRSLVMVSGRLGDGKTVVAANMALASARQGNRVLVIDADFGNQRLADLLSASQAGPGLSELVEQGALLADVVQTVQLPGGVTIDLLTRGLEAVTAPEFFRAAGAQAFFAAVRDEYDLVLIDAPPLLQVAYASTIVRSADRALVVVPHRGDTSAAGEVAERLSLLGTEAAGYVYNRAPLRAEMTRSEGSLKDVLGRAPNNAD